MCKTLVFAVLVLLSLPAAAQARGSDAALIALLKSPHWRNDPAAWSIENGVLTITSGEKTDWYIEPTGHHRVASSPLLLVPAPQDFWFSARITVDFQSRFDAGALVVYADEMNWVKFAFESPNDLRNQGLCGECSGIEPCRANGHEGSNYPGHAGHFRRTSSILRIHHTLDEVYSQRSPSISSTGE